MRYLLFSLLCLVGFNLYSQFNPKYAAYTHINIDKPLRYYTDQLRFFYKQHGVDIDYRKIRGIRLITGDMRDQHGNSLSGYFREDDVILIRGYHPVADSFGIYEKIMLITIAHEIGHSQGFLHDTINPDNLMYRSNGRVYDNLIMGKKTLSEILLSPYKD